LEYFPNGHLNLQLVSEKDLINTIVSNLFNSNSPISLSLAASKQAFAVRSIGDNASLGSSSL